MKTVISLSGGMDSTCLLLHLLKHEHEVYGISYDYGQRHRVELERINENIYYLAEKGFTVHHRVVNLTGITELLDSALTGTKEVPEGHYEEESMKKTVVPNRNAIFSSILYGYALSIGADKIALGVHAGDHAIYPDCRPGFYSELLRVFKMGNWDSEKLDFYLPYMFNDKEGILRDCLESCNMLELDFDTVLKNTNTSYNPDEQGRASGTSGADIERIEAFHKIGRQDPVEYVKPWSEVLDHALGVLNK